MREESGMEATRNFVGTRMYGRWFLRWFSGNDPRTKPRHCKGKCPTVATEKVEDTVARDHASGVALRV